MPWGVDRPPLVAGAPATIPKSSLSLYVYIYISLSVYIYVSIYVCLSIYTWGADRPLSFALQMSSRQTQEARATILMSSLALSRSLALYVYT